MRNKCVFAITQEVSERIQKISEKTQLTKGEILEKLIFEQNIEKQISVKKIQLQKTVLLLIGTFHRMRSKNYLSLPKSTTQAKV